MAKVIQITTSKVDTLALDSSGRIWRKTREGWDELAQPPGCESSDGSDKQPCGKPAVEKPGTH